MSLIGSLLTMLVVSFFLQTHLSVPSSGSGVAFGSSIYNSEAVCLFYYINTYFYGRP